VHTSLEDKCKKRDIEKNKFPENHRDVAASVPTSTAVNIHVPGTCTI